MSYFSGLVEAYFKTDSKGRTVYYPWRFIGKGYVLPNEETERKVKRSAKLFLQVFFAVIMVAGVLLKSWLLAGRTLCCRRSGSNRLWISTQPQRPVPPV